MLKQLYEQRQRTDVDAKAEDGGLFYIDLKNGGNIGSFGYGAGNAMGTMDGLSIAGGQVSQIGAMMPSQVIFPELTSSFLSPCSPPTSSTEEEEPTVKMQS